MKIQDEKLAEAASEIISDTIATLCELEVIRITLPIYCCPQACVWLSRATGKVPS